MTPVHVPGIPEPGTRVRVFSVTPELLVEWFKGMNKPRKFRATRGLPDDASFVSCYYDPDYGRIRIFVASETYSERRPGEPVEEIRLEFHELFEVPA